MDLISALYLFVIGANLLLGTLMLFRDLRSRINISFGVLTFFVAVWVFFNYITNHFTRLYSPDALFWIKMSYVGVTPIPSLFAYFSLVFPENRRIGISLTAALFLPVLIIYGLLYSGLLVQGVSYLPDEQVIINFGPMIPVFLVYLLLFVIGGFTVLGLKYRALGSMQRMQIRYVFIGGVIPIIMGLTTNLILPLMKIGHGWHVFHVVGPLSSVLFMVMMSGAIIRYRFMGFNVILGKSIVYTALASFVSALYFGFLYIAARFFQAVSGNYSFFFGLMFFFLFAVVFEPLRDRLQLWVDNIFFRTKFDYEKALKETSSAMSVVADRDRLLKLTARLVSRRMKLSGAALFIYDERHDRYEAGGVDGTLRELAGYTMTANYPLIEYMDENKGVVLRTDLENRSSSLFVSDQERTNTDEVNSDMQKLGVTLCVPSMFKDKMLAFLALGEKLSGGMFTTDDYNFLITLANQNAVFLENSRLLDKEKDAVKILAEAEAREKYTVQLEKINKDLVETREELVKSERLSTLTKLTISLQHEINHPLSDLLSVIVELYKHLSGDGDLDPGLVREKLRSVEKEAKRIRELLQNLANITEPIVKEYIPASEIAGHLQGSVPSGGEPA